jgi:transcriptional regulator with XRE-family HTH domain
VTQQLGQYDDRMARRFGRRVAALRTQRGWRQVDLAQRCGIGRPYISTVEQGKRKVSLEIAKVIAKGLGVSLGELVDGL